MSDIESSDESIEPQSPIQSKVKVLDEDEDYNYIIEPIKPKKLTNKEKKEIDNYNSSYGVEPQYKKKPKGRPKKPLEEKLAKQVITKEKVIYMVQNDKGEFEKAKNPKITAR